MREIKFRLFDKVNKNMVYPSEKIYINMFGKIVLESTYDGEIIEANADEYVLMQYTGLKDKNGKEIYEGDILHLWGGEYCQGYYEFNQKFIVKDLSDLFFLGECENIEILGSIYENPELLEVV